MKALQIRQDGEYSYSHDLLELAPENAREEYFGLLRDLNPVYTGVRYPDVDIGEVENLGELIEDVEDLLGWIEKQLKK